jgi:hypothetical protein
MTIAVTLITKSDALLHLVRDFAHGLGYGVQSAPTASGHGIRIALDEDDDHGLVELLTHVALSAAKAAVDLAEPLFHVTYRHRSVTSEVTLTLRIAEFRIDKAAGIGA